MTSSVSEELTDWFIEKKGLPFNIFFIISHGSNSFKFFHLLLLHGALLSRVTLLKDMV